MSRATTSAAEVRRVSRSVDEAGAASDSAMVLGPNREVMNVVMRNVDDTADVMLYSDNDEGVDLDDELLPPAKPLFPEHHKYSPTVYHVQKGQLVPVKGFTMLDVEAAAKHARESVYDPHTSQSHNIQTHHSPFFLPGQANRSENNFHQNDTHKEEPLTPPPNRRNHQVTRTALQQRQQTLRRLFPKGRSMCGLHRNTLNLKYKHPHMSQHHNYHNSHHMQVQN